VSNSDFEFAESVMLTDWLATDYILETEAGKCRAVHDMTGNYPVAFIPMGLPNPDFYAIIIADLPEILRAANSFSMYIAQIAKLFKDFATVKAEKPEDYAQEKWEIAEKIRQVLVDAAQEIKKTNAKAKGGV